MPCCIVKTHSKNSTHSRPPRVQANFLGTQMGKRCHENELLRQVLMRGAHFLLNAERHFLSLQHEMSQ